MNLNHYIMQCILFSCVTLTIMSCSNDINYTPPAGSTDTAITHYSFDKMAINGENHNYDLTILPGGKIQGWSHDRITHVIGPEDFKDLITDDIKSVIIGTGYQGLGYLNNKAEELIKELEAKGIPVHISLTREAVKVYNQSSKEGLLSSFVLA